MGVSKVSWSPHAQLLEQLRQKAEAGGRLLPELPSPAALSCPFQARQVTELTSAFVWA